MERHSPFRLDLGLGLDMMTDMDTPCFSALHGYCIFYTLKAGSSTSKKIVAHFYCSGLEPNPQYLSYAFIGGISVLQGWKADQRQIPAPRAGCSEEEEP